jgi:hypothetical protein
MELKPYIGWVLVLFMLMPAFLACRQKRLTNTAYHIKEQPSWLQELIHQEQEQPVANPPAQIYYYIYLGQRVFYLTSRCCDQPGKLYDNQGNLICEPDGGITGRGDGRCPDFFENRTDETLIWEDKR